MTKLLESNMVILKESFNKVLNMYLRDDSLSLVLEKLLKLELIRAKVTEDELSHHFKEANT